MGHAPGAAATRDCDSVSVSVADLHEHVTRGMIRDHGGESGRDDLLGRGMWFGQLTQLGWHWLLLRKRGVPWSAETLPPRGQAALWFEQVRRDVSPSGRDVARQLARLCGDDSQVTIPWRSLADAVARTDKGGRHVAYTQRGVGVLEDGGWLRVATVGRKRGAVTTFYLMPGPD